MRLEGEIHEIELISQLVELGRDRFTGALRFEQHSIIKIVYFKEGDILSASTNDRGDSLDEILLKAGKVSREHIKQALEKRKDSETLGDALYSLGFISRKELSWARRVQLVGILRSITSWQTGSFQIVPDYLPKREEGTLFQIPQIVIELIVTETDRQKIEHALPSDTLIVRAAGFEAAYTELNLNEEADEIVSNVRGERTVSEIASDSKSDTFSVFKLLHALITLSLLQKKSHVTDEVSGVIAPTADFSIGLDSSVPPSDLTSDEPYFEKPVGPATFDSSSSFEKETAESAPINVPAAKNNFDFDPELLLDKSEPAFAAAPIPIPAAVTSSYKSSPAKRGSGRKNRKPLFLMIAIGLLLAGGLGGWYWMQREGDESAPLVAAARPARVPPAVTRATTSGGGETTNAPAGGDISNSEPETTPMNVTATAPQPSTVTTTAPPAGPSPAATTPQRPVTPPQSAVVPSTSGFSARAIEHARNADRSRYALQIEVVCQDASVQRAENEGGPKIWYIPTAVGNRACFRVLFGSYATREEAVRGAGEVPRSLKDGVPVAVAISKVIR